MSPTSPAAQDRRDAEHLLLPQPHPGAPAGQGAQDPMLLTPASHLLKPSEPVWPRVLLGRGFSAGSGIRARKLLCPKVQKDAEPRTSSHYTTTLAASALERSLAHPSHGGSCPGLGGSPKVILQPQARTGRSLRGTAPSIRAFQPTHPAMPSTAVPLGPGSSTAAPGVRMMWQGEGKGIPLCRGCHTGPGRSRAGGSTRSPASRTGLI